MEEYHKAITKTGVEVESLQFTSEAALQPVIALLSVGALFLLNLRNASRRADAKPTPRSRIAACFVCDGVGIVALQEGKRNFWCMSFTTNRPVWAATRTADTTTFPAGSSYGENGHETPIHGSHIMTAFEQQKCG